MNQVRTRVKICGITRFQDAQRAVALGADAIGLVFYDKSPRVVSLPNALDIVKKIAPLVSIVGLFFDASRHYVRQIVDSVPIDLLQFHGDECPADCGIYGKPYIKAIPMGGAMDVAFYAQTYPDAKAYLLDSHAPGDAGGSGIAFNWERVPADLGKPLILAGGLDANNVSEAIRLVRPYAVDVSSGVEREKGIKDYGKMAEFMNEVRRVDCERN
jgi:phosphoribosylanthranilate isomerase